jgi:hypothetical protein
MQKLSGSQRSHFSYAPKMSYPKMSTRSPLDAVLVFLFAVIFAVVLILLTLYGQPH